MASQKDRSEATRRLILDAGQDLFGSKGFDATTIDDIAAQAGLAKGAIYHHYKNKRAIFQIVFERVSAQLADGLVGEIQPGDNMIAVLMEATRSFFAACAQPEVLQIMHRDGPTVLGHAEWLHLDAQYFGGLVSGALEMAMATGAIKQQPLDPLSRVILGALQGAILDCAQQSNYEHAAEEYLVVFEGILEGLK